MTTSTSKIIAVDLCNTLAQVNSAIEELFGPLPNPSILYHPTTPPSFWADPENRIAREIFRFAEPFPGSRETLEQISHKGWQFVYLTSRPEWAVETSKQWLNLNGFPPGPVITTTDKFGWVQRHPVTALVIEDDPDHIKPLRHIVPVFVPAHPWNEGLSLRFSWKRERGAA